MFVVENIFKNDSISLKFMWRKSAICDTKLQVVALKKWKKNESKHTSVENTVIWRPYLWEYMAWWPKYRKKAAT